MNEATFAIAVSIFAAVIISFSAAVKKTGWVLPGIATLVAMFFATAVGAGIGHPFLVTLIAFLALLAWVLLRKNESQLIASGHAPAGFKKCLACAEVIRAEATKCRFCGTEQSNLNGPVA